MICDELKKIYKEHIHPSLNCNEITYSRLFFDLTFEKISDLIHNDIKNIDTDDSFFHVLTETTKYLKTVFPIHFDLFTITISVRITKSIIEDYDKLKSNR
jgi:hypothetical protein